jgi:alkylation response protein AidB-like acyl-CoA dehydrogenase
MGSIGFLCPRYPVEIGGGGGDKIMQCIMAEELNRINAGIAASLMVQGGLSTQPIYRFGSEEQKGKFLIPAKRR